MSTVKSGAVSYKLVGVSASGMQIDAAIEKAGVDETHVCVYACERVNKTGGLVGRVQAASFQQLLAFPADLALNSLNLPAESRNWATRGILGETAEHREDE